jgi:hypothetical protein
MAANSTPQGFASFREFYPYYLGEHSDVTCRRLHFVGTTLALLLVIGGLATGRNALFVGALFCGYGFAWVGHYVFEHNRPATFKYPFYSLAGDFVMARDILIGRIRW